MYMNTSGPDLYSKGRGAMWIESVHKAFNTHHIYTSYTTHHTYTWTRSLSTGQEATQTSTMLNSTTSQRHCENLFTGSFHFGQSPERRIQIVTTRNAHRNRLLFLALPYETENAWPVPYKDASTSLLGTLWPFPDKLYCVYEWWHR